MILLWILCGMAALFVMACRDPDLFKDKEAFPAAIFVLFTIGQGPVSLLIAIFTKVEKRK